MLSEPLIPIRIKNDNCVASLCRAVALSAASRLVLLSNANWNYKHNVIACHTRALRLIFVKLMLVLVIVSAVLHAYAGVVCCTSHGRTA